MMDCVYVFLSHAAIDGRYCKRADERNYRTGAKVYKLYNK